MERLRVARTETLLQACPHTHAVLARQEEDSKLAFRESTGEDDRSTAALPQTHCTGQHLVKDTRRTGWTVCLHANTQDSEACLKLKVDYAHCLKTMMIKILHDIYKQRYHYHS